MGGVRAKLSMLKDVFTASTMEEVTRERSAVMLQAAARRYSVGKRRRALKAAALDWRRSHSQVSLCVCV